jgi:hypothetical protein
MTRISGIESNPSNNLEAFGTYGRHFGLMDGTGLFVEDLLSTISRDKEINQQWWQKLQKQSLSSKCGWI